MDSQKVAAWLTRWLGPSLPVVITTFLIALALPFLLHLYLYKSRAATHLPAFLLTGPSGAGKTALLTLFERGVAADTHVSQTPLTVECSLPVTTVAASSKYRSVNDPSNQTHRKFLLVDTPGHGKLRYHALESVTKPQNLKGIVFIVDASDLSSGSEDRSALLETAQYLHDILLTLQTRHASAKPSKGPSQMPVLIAANKLDLFTALPAKLVKSALESEITKLKNTCTKGLVDSGIGVDDASDNDQEVLGGGGEDPFKFSLMEEYNVPIEILGGNCLGADGPDSNKWWKWIAQYL